MLSMTDVITREFTTADLAELRRREPKLAAILYDAIEAEAIEEERARCEGSLIEFFIRAWPEIGEPGSPIISWHHEEIAAHLEAVARGEIRALVINQPPRTSKSSLVNCIYPAWLWAQPPDRQAVLMGPHVKILSVSYGATLAEDMAVKMRRLVTGAWYQKLWGHRIQLHVDQAARSNFGNTAGGERMSYSIEGGILGRGGDIQIIDDPHHIKGAESEVQRRETLEGMRALVTRVTDPRRSARIMVMQRLNMDDATNYALENWGDDVVHLWYPMRFDETRPCPSDHRSREGELLWPEVWNEKAVRQEEKELGPYHSSGQLQQAPVPRGGGVIKRAWWRLWPDDADAEVNQSARYRCASCNWAGERFYAGPEVDCPQCGMVAQRRIVFPETSFRILSLDTGIGDKEVNSFSAGTVWGIWHGKDEAPRVILMEAWRGRPMLRGGSTGEKGLVEIAAGLANRRLVDLVLIEKKTRGVDLYNELERELRDYPWSLDFFDPTGRGDKTARLTSTQPLFTNDLIWAPNTTWAETVINEVSEVPFSRYDDLADTFSSAMIYLRDSGRLSMSHEHAAEVRRAKLFRGKASRFNASELYEGA